MSGKVIKGGFGWHGAKEKPLTSQEAGSLLLQGWQAAERGEPLDHSQPWHWVQGFRLWCTAHPAKANPMAVSQ
jgi:hypothetical protein